MDVERKAEHIEGMAPWETNRDVLHAGSARDETKAWGSKCQGFFSRKIVSGWM